MQDKISLQKSVADIILSKLELLDRYCIIAGGAPRDWYFGNLAADIDIYLYYPIKTTSELRIKLLEELGFSILNKHENWKISELYKSNHNISYMYDCLFLNEKVQIIFVNCPTFSSVVDTFPISISKIWYKKEKINTTPDFEFSVKYKVLWKTVDSYPEDDKYLLKIRNKFSDYTYINKQDLKIYKLFKELSLEEKELMKKFIFSM